MSRLERIPIFVEDDVTLNDFRAVYDVVKCVCFRSNNPDKKSGETCFPSQESGAGRKRKRPETKECSWSKPLSTAHTQVIELIRETYESSQKKDKESWNVENRGRGHDSSSPSNFLSRMTHSDPDSNGDGYCSFVLQDNSNHSVSNFTERMEGLVAKIYGETTNGSKENMLPHSLLLTTTKNSTKKNIALVPTIAPHYWIFLGRNNDHNEWLPGRKEHTDSIQHDGTFHHQLVGGKLWKLRPTLELRQLCDEQHDTALLDSYEILVEEGDVFVINTRLWWHQTELPPGWSVSYARDLYLDPKSCAKTNLDELDRDESAPESVSNREVSWASGFIEKGTTLVVADEVEETDFSDTNEQDYGDSIYIRYGHLVPPTIMRTHVASKANLKLVVFTNEKGAESDGSESEKVANEKPKETKQVALEALRDIQEGEEFIMLQEEND